MQDLGNTIIEPTSDERAAWRLAAQPLTDRRLEELNETGIHASTQYQKLLDLSASLEVE